VNLKAEYTKYGQGQMIVILNDYVFFQMNGDTILYVEGQPNTNLDGGAFAEQPRRLDAETIQELINEGWVEGTTLQVRRAIVAAFKAGPQKPEIVKAVTIGKNHPDGPITLGLLKDRPEIIVSLIPGSPDPQDEWMWSSEMVSPPLCVDCIIDGHVVEVDGECPHGKRAYTLAAGLC
jgi:hypothetical protein